MQHDQALAADRKRPRPLKSDVKCLEETMSDIAQTPEPPYYAVTFSNHRTEGNNGYGEMARQRQNWGRTTTGLWYYSEILQISGSFRS